MLVLNEKLILLCLSTFIQAAELNEVQRTNGEMFNGEKEHLAKQ